MPTPKPPTLLLLALLFAGSAGADAPWPTLEPGPHAVGYRTVDVTDPARTVEPLADWRGRPNPGENFRRLRVSIWYPALTNGERARMSYREYVEAARLETRIEGRLLTGTEAYLAHSTFAGADPDLLARHLDTPTTAVRDAIPLAGRFPAVVYAPSFSYEAFENSALFEYLASHGYIVAASRSTGSETRSMSDDLAGAVAGRRDLEALIRVLHRFGIADLRRIGAAGFSWGALSAVLLAIEHANVRAVVALDGSLEHDELTAIDAHYGFRPRRLRGGYLALVGDREPARSLADSALYTDVVELRLPDLAHWDFASDMIRLSVWGRAEPDPERRARVESAYGWIAERVRGFLDAHLGEVPPDPPLTKTRFAGAPQRLFEVQTLTARPALPAPPSPQEFAELLRRDVTAASAALARAKEVDPELEIVDWTQLQDVILTSPFETKLEILELIQQELGESSIYFNNLGQAWRLEGDRDRALGYFRRALELNPESGFAQRAIAEIEGEL